MRVRLTHIDGRLPNLALMRLAAWHRGQGDAVTLTRSLDRAPFEGDYDRVYDSAIFTFSAPRTARLQRAFPNAIIGGTGSNAPSVAVEDFVSGPERLDYADYPEFTGSLGFTQRGCRLKCKFCVVPAKEGKPQSVNTVANIWRGGPYPKHLHLLDNDFFGQPVEQWRARLDEIRSGGFKVCFNQGINVRLLDEAAAAELATVEYRDDGFTQRRLYTAWDNLKDEAVFFRGVERLERAGIPPGHLMVYMLVGYDPAETWERIFHRFDRMVERGIRPYRRRDLTTFQRWVITGLYRAIPWADYRSQGGSAAPRPRPVRPLPSPVPFALTDVAGEPRCLDADLASALGYGRPERIRPLIRRLETALLALGTLPHGAAKSSGGRPAHQYLLNRAQALLLISRCKLPDQDRVTRLLAQMRAAHRLT